ncbi:glucosamine-6-phosphate deaminase-like protein [Anatilimnocola aggregata]|uniref:Glucosamine-6-phosphate deaminase-like protein n=1 Tax=Anatilimnocola aggregata TaxID=2528021 RepID=A0A517Y9I1_9BACT|nr:PIG-L deacetylase family protein [Anatilimnocola aggregata]QDU26822.1 glucosamine-6-phosphate deaminase-like protein [Anatilimnocola aggregata]
MNTKNILVLAPHPDDESLGCGGTIKMLTQAGKRVDVIFMTRGENGFDAPYQQHEQARAELASTREAEARAACAVLGVQEVEFLKGVDGGLQNQPHLAQSIAFVLNAGNYHRVFAPWLGEAHPDHAATFRLLQRALADTGLSPSIWLYEVWTPLLPTDLVPIDPTMAAKREAITKHVSQLAVLDYLGAFVGLAAYRALSCPPSHYAEAFLTVDTQTFLAMK